ncbi:MAG: histidine--tRNA ligase [Candidatus Woesearchaeota archaeon]|nr:MAG: histidine--tRNA ligase [Candidatus Woesearchaeota archaeon]
MKLERAKGTKDYGPEINIVRQRVVDTLKRIFMLYGFNPLETPVLERYETLSAKYAGGDEILKELFKLKDQGNRDLALRFDLTVPFSRYVGMNPNLKMPFKRFEIGKVFRDGPVSLERFREFTQCDIDVVGVKGMIADAEIIKVLQRVFKELKLDILIKVNNRKVLDSIMEAVKIPEDKRMDIILTIDKTDKITQKELIKELESKGLEKKQIKDLLSSVYVESKDNKENIKRLKELLVNSEGILEVEELFKYIDDKNVLFVPSLARGLAYYTGTVYEVFLKDGELKTSLAAGGRFDNMIGGFLGQGEYPSVGVAFGLDRITEVLSEKIKSVVKVYVVPIKTLKESLMIAEELRDIGINADIDMNERGISKNLGYANSYGIPYCLILGKKELEQGKFTLRDMNSGKEELLSLEEVKKRLKG